MFADQVPLRLEKYGNRVRGWATASDSSSHDLPDWFLALFGDQVPEGLSDWTAVIVGGEPPNQMVELVLRGPVAGGHA